MAFNKLVRDKIPEIIKNNKKLQLPEFFPMKNIK